MNEAQQWMAEQMAQACHILRHAEIKEDDGRRLWLNAPCFVINAPSVETDTAKCCSQASAACADFQAERPGGSQRDSISAERPFCRCAPPPQVAKFAPGGLASDDEVDELVLEDVGGELEAALTSTTPAPDGSRPEGGAGVAACNEDAVELELEGVAAELQEALTSTSPAPDGTRPEEGAGVVACNEDAVELDHEDVAAELREALTWHLLCESPALNQCAIPVQRTTHNLMKTMAG